MGIETAILGGIKAITGYQAKKKGEHQLRQVKAATKKQIAAQRVANVEQIGQSLGQVLKADQTLAAGLGRQMEASSTATGSAEMAAIDIHRTLESAKHAETAADLRYKGGIAQLESQYQNSLLSIGGGIASAWGAGPEGTSGLLYGPTSDLMKWA